MLVYSAADFEDFRVERPEMPANMESDLEPVIRHLVESRWPWRLHATYDETITRALDVYEKVNRDMPFDGLHWFFDHAETISDRNIDRIAALGGGIAVQHRMAYQGEYFMERYGAKAAEATPPIGKMLKAGIPVGAGTDATRGGQLQSVGFAELAGHRQDGGGTRLYPPANRVDREEALRLWTTANTWFSNEEGKKGQIAVGQLGRPGGAQRRLPDRGRGRDPAPVVGADPAGRQGCPWRRRLHQTGAGPAAADARLVAGADLRRRYQDRSRGHGPRPG
ncbi:amidohydrolase family protein [Caulobacter segnis]